MVMYRPSCSSHLMVSMSVLVILLWSSPISGEYCTCNAGAVTSAEAISEPAACKKAASNCVRDRDCAEGEECESPLNCGTVVIRSRFIRAPPNAIVLCEVRCTGGDEKCVKSGDGEADPHLTGFDGSHYDFHGENGKHYVLVGRSKGDVLVTRMRSSREISPTTLVEKTFFDEFGLQLRNCSHRLSISLVLDNQNPGQWRSQMKVDGKEMVKSQNIGCADVQIGTRSRTITITTDETKYSFTAKLRPQETMRRHIDVNVKLRRSPQTSDNYFGVLGFTLNKVIGRDIHADLDVASREKIKLENSLRRMFQVDSLFPSYRAVSTDLEQTVRTVTGDAHFHIPLQLSAEVKST